MRKDPKKRRVGSSEWKPFPHSRSACRFTRSRWPSGSHAQMPIGVRQESSDPDQEMIPEAAPAPALRGSRGPQGSPDVQKKWYPKKRQFWMESKELVGNLLRLDTLYYPLSVLLRPIFPSSSCCNKAPTASAANSKYGASNAWSSLGSPYPMTKVPIGSR